MMRILLLMVGIALYACSGPAPKAESAKIGETPFKTLKIDSTVTINASDLIADISFVRLETSWKCMIGRVEQILFADDKIIVFDRYKAKAIYVFDKSGKFLNKIGMLGHGPQEYVGVEHIALLPGNEQVAVFDLSPKKVKIYDLDGKFVTAHDLPLYIYSGEYLTDDIKVGATIGRRSKDMAECVDASFLMFNKE